MRIAIPVVSGEVFSPLANAEAFHFYEDDHGKIVREFLEPMEESSTDAAVGLLERYGIDALLCGTIDDTERTAVGMAGNALPRLFRQGRRRRAALSERQRRVRPEPPLQRLRLQRSVLPEG